MCIKLPMENHYEREREREREREKLEELGFEVFSREY